MTVCHISKYFMILNRSLLPSESVVNAISDNMVMRYSAYCVILRKKTLGGGQEDDYRPLSWGKSMHTAEMSLKWDLLEIKLGQGERGDAPSVHLFPRTHK